MRPSTRGGVPPPQVSGPRPVTAPVAMVTLDCVKAPLERAHTARTHPHEAHTPLELSRWQPKRRSSAPARNPRAAHMHPKAAQTPLKRNRTKPAAQMLHTAQALELDPTRF